MISSQELPTGVVDVGEMLMIPFLDLDTDDTGVLLLVGVSIPILLCYVCFLYHI